MTVFRVRVQRLGPSGWIGVALLVGFGLVVVLAPVLAPFDPAAAVGPPYAPPSPANPLGTNDVGQDLLSNLVYGARASVGFGLGVAVLATALGGLVGAGAALLGGWAGAALMRLVDVILVLPFLPLLIIAAAFAGRSGFVQLVLLAGLLWTRPARIVRAQALAALSHGYVEVAQAMGASRTRLLLRHFSHDVAPMLVPVFVRAAMLAVTLQATLAFLGLGDPLQASWGTMLYWAQVRSVFLSDAWAWWVLPPGLAIALLVIAFGMIGIAVEDRLNPALARETLAARG
ncbi:MAG: ABC transporter permease [Pseudonocardia sp.]